MKKIILFLGILFVSLVNCSAQFTMLFNFGNSKGSCPHGSLVSDGTFLYGMTISGGIDGVGTIFRIKPDGTGDTTIFSFEIEHSAHGLNSESSLVFDGTFLCGIGDSFIFKIKPDGTEFTPLYGLPLSHPGFRDGEFPTASLLSYGTFLYGITSKGGDTDAGTIFKIHADGSGYAKLFNFNDTLTGSHPTCSLITDGTYLYGTTAKGGRNNSGTIFKILPDGTGDTVLFNFADTTGRYPSGSLISDGTFLYVTTSEGGVYDNGTILKIKPDGTAFAKLLDFDGVNGKRPLNSLIFDGVFLYGITNKGGVNDYGAIFKIKPDGSEYNKLLDLDSVSTGCSPYCSLISDGTFLYATTSSGGVNLSGTIFKVKPDGSGYLKLLDFGNMGDGRNPLGSLMMEGDHLYGMTAYGGINSNGTIFKIKPDGTDDQLIFNFNGVNGSSPCAALISDGTFLYGMTPVGGLHDDGTLFKIKPDGTGYLKLLDFKDTTYGSHPRGALLYDGTFLYGTTADGGTHNTGTIFKIKPDGTSYTRLLNFNGAVRGNNPYGSLILNGSYLYGTASKGGANSYGTIFKIKRDGSGFTKLHDFDGNNGDNPTGTLFYDSTYLYGMTRYGGIIFPGFNGMGTMFKIKPDGTDFTKLLDFDGSNGEYPSSSLNSDGTFLFGMTNSESVLTDCLGGCGTMFKIKPDGTEYNRLLDFNSSISGINGSKPFGALISDGTFFYGTTSEGGGIGNAGTIFKLPIPPIHPTCAVRFTGIYDSTSNALNIFVDPATTALAASYYWSPGFGSSSTVALPPSITAPGSFTNVCLAITTDSGDACYECHTYYGYPNFTINIYDSTIAPPPAPGCIANCSMVHDGVLNTYTLTVDSATTAIATSYLWDFGDGTTSTLTTPSHIYAIGIPYTVCMKIYTATGDSCSYCHPVSGEAGFSINVHNTLPPPPPVCIANYTTTYDGVADNFILTVDSVTTAIATSYHWDFGDGSMSSLTLPTHAYTTAGSYNVCMKVYTAEGDSCSYCHLFTGDEGFTINIADTVVIPSCIAGYSTAYDSTLNTFVLTVDSATMALATSYHWDFGDGSTSTLATPFHIYTVDSLYNVCMKVYYADGDSCAYCHTIGIDSAGNIIRDGGFSLVVHNATTGISENSANEIAVTIYPNPNTGIFQLVVSNGQLMSTADLSIYNVVGEKIYAKNGKQLNPSTTIDLSDQPNGIYFMQLKTEKNTITKKVIVNR